MPRLLVPAMLLAAAVLYPVFSADAILSRVELSAVASTTITVSEPCDGPVVEPDIVVKDVAGNVITETTVGTQVMMEGTVFIDCVDFEGEPRLTLFEVRTKEGITTFIAWQNILEHPSGRIVASQSWTPDKPGEYEVRLFSPVCLRCPMVLSNIVTYEITVV